MRNTTFVCNHTIHHPIYLYAKIVLKSVIIPVKRHNYIDYVLKIKPHINLQVSSYMYTLFIRMHLV